MDELYVRMRGRMLGALHDRRVGTMSNDDVFVALLHGYEALDNAHAELRVHLAAALVELQRDAVYEGIDLEPSLSAVESALCPEDGQ